MSPSRAVALTLTLWALTLGSQDAQARRAPRTPTRVATHQAPIQLTKTGLVRAINGLLVANMRHLRKRAEIDGGLFKPRWNRDQKQDLKLNPQARLRRFDSIEQLNREVAKFYAKPRPCAERFYGDHDVSIARVRSKAGEVEVINTHPESYSRLGLNVIRYKDYLMLMEYNVRDLRMKPTFAVQVDKKGNVTRTVPTLDFLLEHYPHEKVVLTRTMNHREKKMWKDPRTRGTSLGSELMKFMMGTEHKHLCTASGGYWNDAFVFWQDQVAFNVSKSQLKKMVNDGQAYITPLGYEFDRLSRRRVEQDVLFPFEFTAIHPKANKALQRAYLATEKDGRIQQYDRMGHERSKLNYPLGLFDPGLSMARGPLSHILESTNHLGGRVNALLANAYKRACEAPDGPKKDAATIKFVKLFLQRGVPVLQRGDKQHERKYGRPFYNNKNLWDPVEQLERWYGAVSPGQTIPATASFRQQFQVN